MPRIPAHVRGQFPAAVTSVAQPLPQRGQVLAADKAQPGQDQLTVERVTEQDGAALLHGGRGLRRLPGASRRLRDVAMQPAEPLTCSRALPLPARTGG